MKGGDGRALCLKLGGTNERTSSKAELVEVQRPMCVGGVRGCAVFMDVAGEVQIYTAYVMLDSPGLWEGRLRM